MRVLYVSSGSGEGERARRELGLAASHATFETATSVTDALARLEQDPAWDLVVADLGSLGDDGRAFTAEVQARIPGLPLVAASSTAALASLLTMAGMAAPPSLQGGLEGRPSPAGPDFERERDLAAALVQVAPVIIVLLDRTGRILHANPHFEQLTGYRLEEVRGKDWFESLLPARDRDRIRALFQTATAGTQTRGNVNPIVTRAGEEREIEWCDEVMRGPDGTPVGLLAIGQDVTERRRTEEQLKASEKQLRDILDGMFAYVALYTPDGVMVEANRHALDWWGLTREQMVRGRPWENEHWANEPDTVALLKKAMGYVAKGNSIRSDFEATLAGGRRVTIDSTLQPLTDENGNVVRLLSFGVDVTDRKRAEDAVRASEKHLRDILDGMFAYVALYTPDGVMLEANQHTLDQWGLTREQMVGRRPWETERWANEPDMAARLKKAYARVAEGKSIRGDVEATVAGGRRVVTDSTLQPLTDEDGNVVRLLSFAVDVTDRKRAEEALRASEARLREAQRITNLGSWELDLAEGVLTWSDEIYRMFEIDPAQFGASYEAFLNAIHPEDREAVDTAYTTSVATREPYQITHRLLFADGRVKHVQERCETFYDGDGTPLRSVGTVQDITERWETAEALRRSEELLRTVIGGAPLVIFALDAEGRFTLSDGTGLSLLGLRPGQVVGMSAFDLYADVPEMAENLRRALAGETAHYQSVVGSTWFDATYAPAFDRNGKVEAVIGVAFDITERHHAEEALRKSESRNRDLIEGALDGIFVNDREGRYVDVNPSGCEMLGYTREELLALSVEDLVPAEDRESAPLQLDAILAGLAVRSERRMRKKDGTLITVEISAAPLEDGLFQGIVRDITTRKQAAEAVLQLNAELEERVKRRTAALEAANKELETFAYSVSHDLKAPLRSIDGYSRLLLEDYAERLGEEGQQFLRNVCQATAQMGGLIDDLLAYSRLERRDMQTADLDPAALARTLVEERAGEIRRRGATVSLAFTCGSVRADRDGLAIALRNLLENAVKFMGDQPHPAIEMGGREEVSGCVLWVRDNGMGFDPKFNSRIFEIFQRLHRAEEYPGTGIGLAMVRKAMDRMGGRAWAESAPGQGATFYLELPR